jgi:hypothetical protein
VYSHAKLRSGHYSCSNQVVVKPVVGIQKLCHDFWGRMTGKYCWKYRIRRAIEDADFITDNEMQISKCLFYYTNPWGYKSNLENQSITNSFARLPAKFGDYLETVKIEKTERTCAFFRTAFLSPPSSNLLTLILKFYVSLGENYCSLSRGRCTLFQLSTQKLDWRSRSIQVRQWILFWGHATFCAYCRNFSLPVFAVFWALRARACVCPFRDSTAE